MRNPIAVAVCLLALSARADPAQSEADSRLLEKYTEPDSWANRANFYVGARGGAAIPAGAVGVAGMGGLELGVANSNGFGFGLHALWMNNTPAAPTFNIPAAAWGLGALADFRYYFATIEPLTIYPTLSIGFLAGPAASGGSNAVLPLLNPGIGARVKLGNFYGAFEFGFASFTIPYVALSFGYESDRRHERAEKWSREQKELAREGKLNPPSEVQVQAAKRAYREQKEAQAHPEPQETLDPQPESSAPPAPAVQPEGAPSKKKARPADPDSDWSAMH